MYDVKRYTVSHAREQLADVLDEAERTGQVIIERRNVQYVISVRRSDTRRPAKAAPAIEVLDPAIDAGEWNFTWSPSGLRLKAAKPRR
jgi:hypothetical protein